MSAEQQITDFCQERLKEALFMSMTTALEWRFCHPDAESLYNGVWMRSRPDDAGIDLRIMEDVTIPPEQAVKCNSGIAINIQNKGIAAMVLPRSGLGTKGIILGNSVGLIDCGYQGELFLSMWNRGHEPFSLKAGERVAQLVLVPVLHPRLQRVERFNVASERGEAGFGSSGTK